MLQKKVNLFGLLIDDIDMDSSLALARESLFGGEQKSFFTPNIEILDGARKSAGVCAILNSASVCLPDGFGLRVVAKLMGKSLQNTVSGINFGENLLEMASCEGKKVFLLGGKEGVAQRASENLKRKHPNLQIVGEHHGFFSDSEIDDVCQMINRSNAEILIVCRGFPRQEKFVFVAKRRLLNIKVFACLGGALDIWSGDKKRAPVLLIKMRLEWLWRILCERDRAQRFIISLDTLFFAIKVWFEKMLCSFGMKREIKTYNQTRKSIEF